LRNIMSGVSNLQGAARFASGRSASDDFQDLSRELANAVSGEVRFDAGSRALYATGGANWRQVPIGVVIPLNADDVVNAVKVCSHFGAPILSRGGGTALAGQTANVAVVIDFSKYMNRLVSLDAGQRVAVVQPGLILDGLRNHAERYHLTFGPDPSTHDHCTLGGMIGNNSCGTHSVMAGRTSDNVEELEILTFDGVRMRVGATRDEELASIIARGGRRAEIYRGMKDLRDRYAELIRQRYPKIPRRVSGYNLDELLPENGFNVARALTGTEGTCVTILEAKLRLVPSPPERTLVVLGYPDIYAAADHVTEIMKWGPIACEAIDYKLVENMRLKGLHSGDLKFLPRGHGWLLLEFGGESKEEADRHANGLVAGLQRVSNAPDSRVYDDRKQEQLIWKIREAGLGATALVPGEKPTWEGWEDSAVAPERLGNYLRDFRQLLNRFGYGCALYGHFGRGCVHTRIDFDLETREGIQKYHSFTSHAADLVVAYGGSLSGEHGDGQSRAEFLPKMFGEELVRAFAQFKALWDPRGKMNPHKVVSPYSNIDHLRLGADYRPPRAATYFKFPEDGGDFASAALRCVGVGKCRRMEGGVMCPSFMATREEMHSTRGRAHLLFEMLHGDPLRGGWNSGTVREALDLCLACKGCKGECPVNVDMATYKAEFLAHYYRWRLRPMSAHSMGRIDQWARIASWFPQLANFATQNPVLGGLSKTIAGIAPERAMPPFARQTFRQWFSTRASRGRNRASVMLWPDTFNNYFHPEVAVAATKVLEDAGVRVVLPRRVVCCGRPLYDFGLLRPAQRYLRAALAELQPELRDGTPIVVLEPSCLSVFREEARNLLPHDRDVFRLHRQAMTLSEFLGKHAPGYQPPKLEGRSAIVQPHCHHKSVLGFDTEHALLERTGIKLNVLESGCCGMAGSFGFERAHYEISMKIGERGVLPAVRAAQAGTLVVADGFSCATQIEQGAGRHAIHLAQLLAMNSGRGSDHE
jgi:FAD/FMN-containing dehydrogenase/Fe-S oxidoreductase